LIKDEAKITLKTAIKAKNVFNKKIERFCWEKMKRKLTCLTLLWKREKFTLVTLVWLEKP
jgi:hypothetical protein